MQFIQKMSEREKCVRVINLCVRLLFITREKIIIKLGQS
jgi:hypothetical protein